MLDLVSREGNRLSATEVIQAADKPREVEQAPPSNLALIEMVAKHIQWEKAKATALGVVDSVKEAAMSVAKKAYQAGISPLIGQQALAFADGLADVQYTPETPKASESSGPVSRSEMLAQASELGRALQPSGIEEPPKAKESLVKRLGAGRGLERPRSGNMVRDLQADAERARKTREAEMRDREAARNDDKGFADKTDSSRWDIRQAQQVERDKERKAKNKDLLADMSARFRRMRDGPD